MSAANPPEPTDTTLLALDGASTDLAVAYLHALHDASPDGFMLFRAVRAQDGARADAEGTPGAGHAAGAVPIVDFEWRYANAAAGALVGRDPDALIGRRLLDEMPGNGVDGLFDAYVGVVTSGTPWQREFTYGHEGVDATFRTVAIRVDDGFGVTFSDITTAVRAETTLRATAARLRLLADAGRALGSVTEREAACTVIANLIVPRVADACAVDLAGPVGRLTRMATTATAPALAAALPPTDAIALTPSPIASDAPPPLGDFVTVPIFDHGQVIGTLSAATAATATCHIGDSETLALLEELARRLAVTLERAQLLSEAQRARHDAEHANRAKSQFLATMSHELRTPLNAILGYTDLLDAGIGGTLADPQLRYVERVRASGRHLLGLIDDVLDFAKLEAGTLAVAREPVVLRETFAAADALVRPQSRARQVHLAIAEPPSTVRYLGDEERVRQVLVNLLSNALKFTPAGGSVSLEWRVWGGSVNQRNPASTSHHPTRPPALVAASEPDDAARSLVPPPPQRPAPEHGWLCIDVRDTGIGIPAHALDRIFEPFVQVDASRTRTAEGTGLGLAISRQFAARMLGDLTVASELGRGSAFALWLPLTPPDSTAEPRARTRIELGRLVLGNVSTIVARVTARLRSSPLVPNATTVSQADLENHLGTFLADFAQQFTIFDDVAVDAVPLVRDGSELQELLVDKHGRQRRRLGWPEGALTVEFDILGDEIARIVRNDGSLITSDLDDVLALVSALLDEALRASLVGYHAGR